MLHIENIALMPGINFNPGNRTTTQRAEPMTRRLIQVLFDELPQQPQQQLHLPVSSHPKIRTMVEMMAKEPVEWGSLGQWAGFCDE